MMQTTAVLVTDVDALPAGMKRTKIVIEADKAAIKDALKAGQEIAGAELQTNRHFRVY